MAKTKLQRQQEEDAFYARYDQGMRSGQATVVHPVRAPLSDAELFEQLTDHAKAYWRDHPRFKRD